MDKAEKLYIAVVLGVGMPPHKRHGMEFVNVTGIDSHTRDLWKYKVRAMVEYERLVPGLISETGFTAWMALFFQWCEQQRKPEDYDG